MTAIMNSALLLYYQVFYPSHDEYYIARLAIRRRYRQPAPELVLCT
jgi:hypothetical protein